jgi:hypothetical protein
MRKPTADDYEAALQRAEKHFRHNKSRMWVLKILREYIAAEVGKGADEPPPPDLLSACETWLAHYDTYVRDEKLGDEPGIAEMRAAVSRALTPSDT